MPRQSVINQREVTANGTIQVRISKQVIDDGEIISSEWHRTAFAPGDDFEGTISRVNAHLVQMKYGAVSTDEWDKVRAMIAVEQTPEVIQAYQAALAAERAARDLELSGGAGA